MKDVFNLRLPQDLRKKIVVGAHKNNLSINQYLLYTLTKTLTYNEAYENLIKTFSNVDSSGYRQVMSKIPSIKPMTGDEL